MNRAVRAAVGQILSRAEYEAQLEAVRQGAYDTIPHDTRAPVAVQKADEDQKAAELAAEGEEETT
jgi:hypothetical protein